MPNWCHNSLVFKGRPPDLIDLVKRIHGDHCPIGFSKISPEPAELSDQDDNGCLSPASHDWRCENWGTKWDIDSPGNTSVSASLFPGTLALSFDTAWSPSLPVTAAASRMFPLVEMDHLYSDESMAFAGRAVWSKGKLVLTREYHPASWEYDLVSRGMRPEENLIPQCDWVTSFPTALALSRISRGSPPPNKAEYTDPPTSTVEILMSRIAEVSALTTASSTIAARLAQNNGFPYDIWAAAGLPPVPELLWSATGSPWTPSPSNPSSKFSICYKGSPSATTPDKLLSRRLPTHLPRLVLVTNSPLPSSPEIPALGQIIQTDSGFEMRAPSGWSVSSSVREGEAVVMVSKNGRCQTPPDGTPSCLHWKISPATGRPFLHASAFCTDGKLWDPRKGVPAYTEYFESGTVRRTASFFAGKLSTTRTRTSVIEFAPSGLPLPRPPHRSDLVRKDPPPRSKNCTPSTP